MENTEPVPEAFPLTFAPHPTMASPKKIDPRASPVPEHSQFWGISSSIASPVLEHHCSGLHHVKYPSKVGDTEEPKGK